MVYDMLYNLQKNAVKVQDFFVVHACTKSLHKVHKISCTKILNSLSPDFYFLFIFFEFSSIEKEKPFDILCCAGPIALYRFDIWKIKLKTICASFWYALIWMISAELFKWYTRGNLLLSNYPCDLTNMICHELSFKFLLKFS